MKMPLSERRQIENEMIFRRVNEKVGTGFDELAARHEEEGTTDLMNTDDHLLHFQCECSDEDCNARIPMKLSAYQKIHKNRDAFIIKLRHQVKEIEKVIDTNDVYSVVEKNNSTAEPGDTLNSTDINNT